MKEKHQPTEDMKTADAPNPVADVSDHNDSNLEVEIPHKNLSDEIEWLPIEELIPDENQPRKYFNEAETKKLADSIKSRGIIQPILYKEDDGKKIVLSGERRLKAAKEVGLETIPCRKVNSNADEIALIENITRENLLPMEEALAIMKLQKEHKYKQEELGEILGKAQNTVSDMIKPAKLPKYIQKEALSSPKWSRSILLKLCKIEDKEEQKLEFTRIKNRINGIKSESDDNIPPDKPETNITKTFTTGIKNSEKLHKQLDDISKFDPTKINSIPEKEKEDFKDKLVALRNTINECIQKLS